jgi:hypothetical protein
VTEVENLMLEHLKRFQSQMTRLEDKIDGLGAGLRGVRQHMAGFMTSDVHRDTDMAAVKAPLERIERRLDLID